MVLSNMYTHEVAENPKYFEKPDNNDNYDNCVKDVFDFAIHRDKIIDKPKKNTCNNKYD